jgi:tetratricopeptide (TPR) repeat protein
MNVMPESGLVYRGLELTAAEIADALWLAAYVTVEATVASQADVLDARGSVSAPATPAVTTPPAAPRTRREPYADLHRAPEQAQRTQEKSIPFYVPAGEALPNKLPIARALRPLLRRVPAPQRLLLNEEATAEAVADGNDLALVLQPDQERWLDLVLLIDESPSMVVWHRTVQELHTLLTQVGAFCAIESWGIGYDLDPDTQAYQGVYLHITSGGGRIYGRRGSPKELIQSTQRRLILLLSDSSSPAWDDGSISAWLNLWGQHNLIALIQFLPRPFWSGTGLRQAVEVVVRSVQPGSCNSRLTIDEVAWYWPQVDPPATPPVPVTTLEPHMLHNWTQMLSGRGQKRVYSYCFTPPVAVRDGLDPSRQLLPAVGGREVSAEARLLHYQQRLSPPARRLAGYLAAVPLSLPIIRLIQKALLPDTTQLHLAEVFHSGILRRSSVHYTSTLDPDTLQYDFLDDSLRDLFLTSIEDDAKHQVLRQVSQYIDSHSGLPYRFESLLFDPTFAEPIKLDEKREPFAHVAMQTLRSMGGVYATLADNLKKIVSSGEDMIPSQVEGLTSTTGEEITSDKTQVIETELISKEGVGGSIHVGDIYHYGPPQPTFPITNLPPANPHFTGRSEQLNGLTDRAGGTTTIIAGLGGVGKSQLMLEFAHRQRDAYDIIWWLRVDEALAEDFLALGRQLLLPVDGLDQPTAVQLVRNQLSGGDKKWLLLCDNADTIEPGDLRRLLPSGPHGRILITSRNPHWRQQGPVLRLDVFTEREAAAFWRERLGKEESRGTGERGSGGEEEALRALGRELGYLPLALEHAAAYMTENHLDAAAYRALFVTRRRELWQRATPPDDYHGTITTTWEIAFEQVRQTPGAADLLNLCCFMAADSIPLDLFSAHAAVLPDPLAAIITDPIALNKAVAALSRYSLLARNGQEKLVSVPRLVQTVARDRMAGEQAVFWAEVAVELVCQVRPDGQRLHEWVEGGQFLPHMEAVANLAAEQGVESARLGVLDYFIGYYLQFRGEYAAARPYYERALAIREKTLGADHPDTATSLNKLGLLLQAMGDLARARPYYERALAIQEKAFGPDHPDTAQSLNNLGLLLQAMGDLARARPYYERALAIQEKALGADHPDIATSLNNMGYLLQAMGELAGARPHYERALAIHEKALGPDDPGTALSLNNLGYLLQAMGDLAGARPYYERAVVIQEKTLGPDHPHTATSLDNLDLLLQAMRDLAGAKVIHGDEVRGDKIGGDKITVGNISGSQGIAIGRGARADVRIMHGPSVDELTPLFAPLLAEVARHNTTAVTQVKTLQAEVARGEDAEDDKMADLITDIAEAAPAVVETLVNLFTNSIAAKVAGGATKFVLRRLHR